MSVTRELPTYRWHQQVQALEISHIVQTARGHLLGFKDQRFSPHEVSNEWLNRYNPQPGGYFVLSDEGQTYLSPDDFVGFTPAN